MKETIAKINEVLAVLQAELAKAGEGNKAAARARKATLELEKLGKEFRKVSIAEMNLNLNISLFWFAELRIFLKCKPKFCKSFSLMQNLIS